ncbi:BTAD domain-containing putative transcriptional regulator [Micromonospora sp. WMMD1102]|uniref:AfsR/SARP family transcriptional regulator n=1 Tax=Micromonospora sp. WMMD1102 TaxID=3016105 RepID=UPI0024151E2F|nr:BTAD domain-containing putative transcriptional regulator [Micromonospora sp. WMMD1102]MDG4788626.1 BTAD domain-containing putative transcriptional regulator [Micromonospora sp. WMMD1102]
MEFRVLGPIEVVGDGGVTGLGGRKPRRLLAALLVNHGRVVATAALAEAVWGPGAPGRTRALLHTYVSTLRTALAAAGAPAVIHTRAPGYLIQVDGTLDRDEFVRLGTAGRAATAAGRWHEAAQLLRQALEQWRGPALEGVESGWLAGEAARLEELRLATLEDRITAELALHAWDAVTAELTDLVLRYPFRERFRGQLMTALAGLGRHPEALEVYRSGRDVLVEQLGLEPGPWLRAVQQAVLRGTAPVPDADGVSAAATATAGVPGPAGPPQPLPPAPDDFTGREPEIRALTGELSTASHQRAVRVVTGPAGVGKSAFAARVAQLISPGYPDGQLYARLDGTTGTPARPHAVLDRLLRQLGVPATALPQGLAEATARYRSLTARRRMVVLLDDAYDEQQVRPLLPANPASAVIVTARRRLTGIAGARLVELGPLDGDESRRMLAAVIWAERVAAQPAAARLIARYCDGLPVALRAVAARLSRRPRWPLHLFAGRLADERGRLDELHTADDDLRTRLAPSYRQLGASARVLFHSLGLLRVAEFTPATVAGALRLPPRHAEQLVEQLVDLQLAEVVRYEPTGQIRYWLPPLLRLYARERAEAETPPGAAGVLVALLTAYWLRLLDPAGGRPGADAGHRASRVDPGRWLAAEYPAMRMVMHTAVLVGRAGDARRLATAVARFVDDRAGRAGPTLLFAAAQAPVVLAPPRDAVAG